MSDINVKVAAFLKDQICLVVEPSQTFSASILACLQTFGLSGSQVMVCRRFDEALRFIAENKPKMLVTEFNLENEFGLALIEAQEKHFDESSRVSIVVTKNNSDSAIAEAAEEQVDAFILKPFSTDSFREKVLEVFRRKLEPTAYLRKIREGKEHFVVKEFVAAVEDFVTAKGLDERPMLACFYAGRSYQEMGDLETALAQFKEGRKHQPLHYKCLIGEFEGLMAQKKYDEAYGLVTIIKANFPLSPQRLGQIFIATVFTRRFDDLAIHFRAYLDMENRTPWLVELTSLAMLTAGKFALAGQNVAKATKAFEMGVLATARDLKYISMVIDELIAAQAFDAAQEFLAKANPADVGSPLYNRISFKVDSTVLGREQLIERGRKLVMAGQGSPEVYESLVGLLAEAGKAPLAESIINRAVEDHPDLRHRLYGILEERTAKAS